MLISPAYAKICSHYFTGERPAFATTLVAILLRCYGSSVLNWEPESIRLQLSEDFHVEEVPRKVHEAYMALITVLTTDAVYKDPETLHNVCNCLNGAGIRAYGGPPVVQDLAWTIAEISLCDPQPSGLNPKDPWSRAVKGYIRVVLDDAGLTIKPKSLPMAAERPGTIDQSIDASTFAGSWQAHQQMADEIDQIVAKRMDKLLEQLRAVGIPVQTKQAAAMAPQGETIEQTLPDGTHVVEVDGEYVRNNIDAGFIGGGHSHAYPRFIPKDQIWIGEGHSLDDQKKFLLHEAIELALMRQGVDYGLAHDTANRIESQARGTPANPTHENENRKGEENAEDDEVLSDREAEELLKQRKAFLDKNTKKAEWTSEANMAAHVSKHSGEFGGPEEYLKAEKEHSENPPADQTLKDVRCKPGPDGKLKCSVSLASPSMGTLHVRTLDDGRTVTLYKPR